MAEAPPLADIADVEEALGRALTSAEELRIEAILDKASADFRRRSRQPFVEGQHTVRLKSNGGELWLPWLNVTAVNSVVDRHGRAVDHTDPVGQMIETPLRSHQFATVDYDYDGIVPDVVRLAIAEVAKRVLEVPPEAAAMGATQVQETKGPFSRSLTFAAWAVGGQTLLSPADVELADSFRSPRHGSVIVQSSR